MRDEEVIDNIAEIIWYHIYKKEKFSLEVDNENKYWPIMFAAREIYQRVVNPPKIKLEMKHYRGNIKPTLITPEEQVLRNVISNLEQKIEHYLLRIKQLENCPLREVKNAK